VILPQGLDDAAVRSPFIAITFAVPEESAAFRRELRKKQARTQNGFRLVDGELDGRTIRIAHIGIGLQSARERTALLLEKERPSLLIAAGFGGALDPTLQIGDVVVDRRTSPASIPGGSDFRLGSIVSSPHALETPGEKAELHRQTGALAVDMETDAIAAICAERGVPLLAVRAISDRAADFLPVPLPAWYDLQRQRPRPLVLMGYLAGHPGAIGPFVRFLRGLSLARHKLAATLIQLTSQL